MADPLLIAVDLVKTSNQLTQSWLTRFITVNGALMSGVGAIISWQKEGVNLALLRFALFAICLLGIAITAILWGVMHRQIRWHNAHVDRMRALQDPAAPLLVDGMVSGGLRLIHMIPYLGILTEALWISLLLAIFFIA